MTKRVPPYSPEVRDRAVRMIFVHQGKHGSQWALATSMLCCPGTGASRALIRPSPKPP